ncbi:MAG: peptide deformylase [Candidatus Portnoybacteria bacterium RIFCSPLOWO2_01_FULL_43_11]|uniref:Peptide deformylase n=3 Tax=Candidatus Portnoyibacteriota TaxID=1817913 RepID=A0A1G2FBH2_9BACT|nr:MAG: peptide deformylase [Candidatus Portnoybacteria bacterium RIFCSPHIGHO2_01_FULL_40_12b]OGZ36380.1 MAG: peptide deformylase [Candidatus Portnoybacteria bacterium RIFCSPHIGHO2_02_FULL_40_23]OGZ38513.1 MAG: peptide deformylase [Candidatus Portnoybacteria bacterium RIFCSPLOWO2_01_FULL_43_11]OGZ40216.1 MAG: peptide deformylase [Candidatus Portnoybacteria bacterium RIFCSPLOWO2_02_FULL_40_15]
MIIPIQTNPNNPILRQKAKEVKEITAEIKRLILDMEETMEKAAGVGLAAPQIGQSLRVLVAKSNDEPRTFRGQSIFARKRGPQKVRGEIIALINPEIKKFSRKKVVMEEGCLSLPKQFSLIERPAKIKVKGLTEEGEKIKIKINGLLARIIQHEIDHLDGILIIDRIK